MMRKQSFFAFILLTFLTAPGCGVFQTLPHFEYNGKSKNHWIVNRIPDYGDGHRDGCVIMGELKVSLRETSPGVFEGNVKDVEERQIPNFARLIINDGSKERQELLTDELGRFSFEYTHPIRTISFNGSYQRMLKVNMR